MALSSVIAARTRTHKMSAMADDEKSLDLSDTSCSHFKYYSKEVAEHCRSVLQSVAQQGIFTREMLNAAVAQLKSCTLPTYK